MLKGQIRDDDFLENKIKQLSYMVDLEDEEHSHVGNLEEEQSTKKQKVEKSEWKLLIRRFQKLHLVFFFTPQPQVLLSVSCWIGVDLTYL